MASVRADFNTIAGKAEPNELGQLLIVFTGADGKLEEREFSVYYSGPKNKIKDTVFVGRTGHPANLVVGSYDVKIPVHPALWIRDVVIENGKTIDLAVGGYGRVLINGKDSTGKPLENDFGVYTHDDKKDIVIRGITNEPSEYILAGTYDIKVDIEPRMIKEVRIESGRDTVLSLPQSGRLEVRGKNALGDPLRTNNVLIYMSGERGVPSAQSLVNSSGELQPGIYDVWVDLAPEVWFEGVKIVSGEERVIDLPELGRLKVRGKDTEGVLINGYEYSLYKPGNSEKEIAAGDVNVARDLLPGVYDVKVKLNPEVWFKGIEVVVGSVKVVDIPPLPAKADESAGTGALSAEQGRIQIVGKNARGNPLEYYYKFYVYAPGDKEKSIAEESVINPVDLQPGVYDVRVEFMPDIWFESVEVAAGQSKVLELSLPGRLDIQGKNALGDNYYGILHFAVYKSGYRKEPLVYQYVNWYKDLPAGVYDIQVNLNPEVWYEGVKITAGESRVIKLPVLGRLEIRGTDAVGASRNIPFTVYTGGEREKAVTDGVVNTPLEIQPGVYDIRVDLETGDTWFNGVEIVSRQSNILELSQPGRIWIYGKNEAGEPLSAAFTVYADRDKETVAGRLDETVDLPAGAYDIKIDLEPEVWYRAIKIVGGQIRIIDLSRQPESVVPGKEIASEEKVVDTKPRATIPDVPSGILEVRGKDAAGEPLNEYFIVYASGERDKSIATGDVNETENLSPGIYDVEVGLDPHVWYEAVRVDGGKTTVIDLPQAGRINIQGKTASGEPLVANFWLYAAGDREKVLSNGYTNKPLDVWAGTYDIVVNLKPVVKYEGIEIVEGQIKVIDLAESGSVQLTAVPEEGAEPCKETGAWYIYPIDSDGKLAEKYIDVSFYNPSGIFILPPGRYLAAINVGEGSGQVEFEVKVGETIEKTVVIGVGYAQLTAVSKIGVEPYKENCAWYVYPVGADGKPAENYLDVSYYNPSGKFILPPGRYLAAINIGKGDTEKEFDVRLGKVTEVTVVVEVGYAQLNAIPKEGEEPYKESCAWYVYPVGADGKPAEDYLDVSYYNPSGKFILPPGRYLAAINIGKGDAEKEFDVRLEDATEVTVVVEVGYVQLTAVPEEGVGPYKETGAWYVYPVGVDGKPAENYLDVSYYNPSDKFILPPGHYLATIIVGKGRAEIEFDVNTDEMTAKTVVVNADAKAELKLEKTIFIPGEEIVVHFIATADFDVYAWAGIIPSHVEHGDEDLNDQHDIDYEYLNGQPSGSISLTAPQTPGQYDVRMHDRNLMGREVASASFTVIAGVSVEEKEQVQEKEQEKVQDAGQEIEQVSGQGQEEVGTLYINSTFRIAVTNHPEWEMKLMPGSRVPKITAAPEQGGKRAFIDSLPRRGSQVLFLKKPSDGEIPSGGFNSNILLAVHDISKNADEASAEAWIQEEFVYTRKHFPTAEITVPPSQKNLNGKTWINYEQTIESTVGEKLELKQMSYVHLREAGGRRYIYVFAATALQSEFEADRQAMEAIIRSVDLFE